MGVGCPWLRVPLSHRAPLADAEVLQKYVPTQASSTEEAPAEGTLDPRIVVALARADLARSRASRRSFATPFHGDGSKGTGFRSLVLTAICGIIVAAVTSLFNADAEMRARWAEEVYSGRRQFLQETISHLTDSQVDAQDLSLSLRQAETGGELLEDAGFYRESLDNLRRKIRRIMAALQAPPKSELRFAQLRAFYEMEALDVCLRKAQGLGDDSKALQEWIKSNQGEDLSVEQVNQILTEASVAAPCGSSFQPDVLDDLIHSVAEELWTLADDAKK